MSYDGGEVSDNWRACVCVFRDQVKDACELGALEDGFVKERKMSRPPMPREGFQCGSGVG